jgi:hypothetical protein
MRTVAFDAHLPVVAEELVKLGLAMRVLYGQASAEGGSHGNNRYRGS